MKHIIFTLFSLFALNTFGQFEEPMALVTELSNLHSINSKDVNGDGDIDLLLAQSFGFFYYENDGNGSFEPAVEIGDEMRRINDIEIADLDGDGDLDMAYVSGEFQKSIGWFVNDGNGGYEVEVFDIDSDDLGRPFDIELSDLDNDGDLDFITTNYDRQELRLTYNLGNGQFGDTKLIDTHVWMLTTRTFDHEGDGIPEIHYLSFTGNAISAVGYFKLNDFGEYEDTRINGVGGNNNNTMDFADIDMDGDLDIISGQLLSERIEWAPNNGNGDYGDGETIWRNNDFELDSRIGFMHLESSSNGIQLYAWSEEGSMYRIDQIAGTTDFADPVTLFEGPHPFEHEEVKEKSFADYNQDGRIDISYINADTLWMRNGAANFVDEDNDGFFNDVDCDDSNASINPDQLEIPYNGLDDDCNPGTYDDDLDQDGFVLAEDCDDENGEVNPDTDEIIYNGLDDDCDTATLDDDLDQDGFDLVDDCDDENSDINPDAEEIPANQIDENCDGIDDPSGVHQVGKLTIEIFPNPTKDYINIRTSDELVYKYELYSQQGHLVLSGNNQKVIDVNQLSSGVYMIKLINIDKGINIVDRIFVER